jgi:hypothetical protein
MEAWADWSITEGLAWRAAIRRSPVGLATGLPDQAVIREPGTAGRTRATEAVYSESDVRPRRACSSDGDACVWRARICLVRLEHRRGACMAGGDQAVPAGVRAGPGQAATREASTASRAGPERPHPATRRSAGRNGGSPGGDCGDDGALPVADLQALVATAGTSPRAYAVPASHGLVVAHRLQQPHAGARTPTTRVLLAERTRLGVGLPEGRHPHRGRHGPSVRWRQLGSPTQRGCCGWVIAHLDEIASSAPVCREPETSTLPGSASLRVARCVRPRLRQLACGHPFTARAHRRARPRTCSPVSRETRAGAIGTGSGMASRIWDPALARLAWLSGSAGGGRHGALVGKASAGGVVVPTVPDASGRLDIPPGMHAG